MRVLFDVAYAFALIVLPMLAQRAEVELTVLACLLMIALEGGQEFIQIPRRPYFLRFMLRSTKESVLYALRHGAVIAALSRSDDGLLLPLAYLASVLVFFVLFSYFLNSAKLLSNAKVPFVLPDHGLAADLWPLVIDYAGRHSDRLLGAGRMVEALLPLSVLLGVAVSASAGAVASLVISSAAALYFFAKGRRFRRAREELKVTQPIKVRDQLAALEPSVLLHFSGGRNTAYQANMWFKPLELLGTPVIVLFRERHHMEEFEATTLPLVYVDATRDLELIVPASVTVSLYAANVGKNLHWLRTQTCKHVFIGHGDSDKAGSAHNLMKVYDHMLVAGQAHIDRMESAGLHMPEGYYIQVGRPQLELFFGKGSV